MSSWRMQAPQANLPYQAYRSKRHSRNVSASSQQQAQLLTPNVSPPPTSRPPTVANGVLNGYGHGLSEPVVPLQRDFIFPTNGKEPQGDSEKHGQTLSANGFAGNGVKFALLNDRRRSVSTADVVPQYEVRRSSPPPALSPAPVPAAKVVSNVVSFAPPSPLSRESSPAQSISAPSSIPVSPPLPPLPNSPTIVASSPTEISKPLPSITATQTQSTTTSPVGSSPDPSTSSLPPSAQSSPRTAARRTSTFRHVPLRPTSARTPLPSSPLRPASTLTHHRTSSGLSAVSRQFDAPSPRIEAQGLKSPDIHALRVSDPPSRVSSLMSTPIVTASALANVERDLPAVPALELEKTPEVQPPSRPASAHMHSQPAPHAPLRGSTLFLPPFSAATPQPQIQTDVRPSRASTAPSFTPSPALSPSSSSSSSRTVTRTPAPYHPGFQPKGVYHPLTDEFVEIRRTRRDDGRVERTRLERRLEKLISLHFPHPDTVKDKEKSDKGKEIANGRPMAQNRRASSFFDFDMSSIRGKSASDLWKGVLQAQAANGKGDIRAAEQAITPWEEDSAVSQCPLCLSSFHPITNRKHHCRLCGRIMCSLPVKYPQRPQTCSILFVADPLTREVEEVGEGVDYGVRRRTSSNVGINGKSKGRDDVMGLSDDEKFLKGVRMCRDCRPVLLRRQYTQEVHRTPLFTRLYDAFVVLEKEIEEALPQFQELVMSLSHEERPTPEASAARKRLLEAFAQYDALAKRIRKLPCPGGPGSSHDRVQQAILTRANLFLQKNMFPLQALPKPKTAIADATPSPSTPQAAPLVDPDSELARVLQPLLEQEALLESFVQEAKARRKFEDAQTLKTNLAEIRAEIDRILANSGDSQLRGTRLTNGKGKQR